jgi:hypothetical protein
MKEKQHKKTQRKKMYLKWECNHRQKCNQVFLWMERGATLTKTKVTKNRVKRPLLNDPTKLGFKF